MGVPDQLLFKGRVWCLVELKQTKGATRPRQKALHAELVAEGAPIRVVRTPAQFRALLEELTRGHKSG